MSTSPAALDLGVEHDPTKGAASTPARGRHPATPVTSTSGDPRDHPVTVLEKRTSLWQESTFPGKIRDQLEGARRGIGGRSGVWVPESTTRRPHDPQHDPRPTADP